MIQVSVNDLWVLLLVSVWVYLLLNVVGGEMASWLVHSTPDQAVHVQALARDIVLCFWARHLTHMMPLNPGVHV